MYGIHPLTCSLTPFFHVHAVSERPNRSWNGRSLRGRARGWGCSPRLLGGLAPPDSGRYPQLPRLLFSGLVRIIIYISIYLAPVCPLWWPIWRPWPQCHWHHNAMCTRIVAFDVLICQLMSGLAQPEIGKHPPPRPRSSVGIERLENCLNPAPCQALLQPPRTETGALPPKPKHW